MTKEEFVARLAEQHDMKRIVAENLINATLAELVGPKIWGTAAGPGTGVGIINDCNNNCKEDLAVATTPVRAVQR